MKRVERTPSISRYAENKTTVIYCERSLGVKLGVLFEPVIGAIRIKRFFPNKSYKLVPVRQQARVRRATLRRLSQPGTNLFSSLSPLPYLSLLPPVPSSAPLFPSPLSN